MTLFYGCCRPRNLHSLPTRRSSDLSSFAHRKKLAQRYGIKNYKGTASQNTRLLNALRGKKTNSKATKPKKSFKVGQDRKSTRLNSSHVARSYAVFCFKTKRTRRSST